MTSLRRLAGLLVLACLIWATPARADIVADGNAIATQLAVPARPGPSSILDLGIVHAALHDAIQAHDGRFHCRKPERSDLGGWGLGFETLEPRRPGSLRDPSHPGRFGRFPRNQVAISVRDRSKVQPTRRPAVSENRD
jgi:hypothetical protein